MTARRRLVAIVGLVAAAWSAGPVGAQSAQAPVPLTLEAALARAVASNPAILAAETQRGVGQAGQAVAKQRPNPEFSYEAARETPHHAFSAAFPLEFGGKRARRIDLANATLDVVTADIDVVIADVRNAVRRTYYDLVAANQRQTLAEDVRTLAARMRDAAEARFASGDAPRLDAVQAALAFADADNDVTAATGDVAASRAELNALLGQPPSTAIEPTDPLAPRALPSLDALLDRANRANADLVALDRRIAEQSARRDLARTLRTPDMSAGSTLAYDAQPEFTFGWRFDFSVTLPVFTQHGADVALEDAALVQARAERDARGAAVAGMVAAAYARAISAREQLVRYEADILPRARDVEQMAQDGYAAGQTSLPVLLQALQAARDVRRRGLQAGLDFQLALADLERALGAPLQ